MAVGKTKLSKEQIDAIDSYGSRIKTIEDFVDGVRKRPGMYIGPIGSAGFLNMIREVLQNSIDQLVSKESPCNIVYIKYDMRYGGVVVISDNGLGIPFDDMIRVFTKAHTSKNFIKKKGDYSAGLNGIGAKVTNALSELFEVVSYSYKGKAKRIKFSKGKVVSEEILDNEEKLQGTSIKFIPDRLIMGDTTLDPVILYNLVRDILSLTGIGNRIDFTSIDLNGKVYHELMVNNDGICTNLFSNVKNKLVDPIIISSDTGEMRIDCAFTFDIECMDGERITSYANMCPTSTTPQNTHVKGFLDGVTSWFTKYMNNIYLGEKSKIKVISNDVKAGLVAMISAFHLEPQFTGQAKEVFSNQDYIDFAKKSISDGLDEWSKNKPNDLQKIAKFIKDCADIRSKTDTAKVKLTTKYAVSGTTGLPKKYRKPEGNKELELLIVEGDSAESGVSQARDPMRQGVFPIRGKILNVFEATLSKVKENEEIASIARILNSGFGKSFDISKVKFDKVIFCTDADVDGAHISSLLTLLFIQYFPGMIENGMVYLSVPPLYGIKMKGGKKIKFFADRMDLSKYTQKLFYTNHTVKDYKGNNISSSSFTSILMKNEDYIYQLESVANRYKVSPRIIETMLLSTLKDESFTQLKKRIIAYNRFINDSSFSKTNNTIVLSGLIDNAIQTIYWNDMTISECHEVVPYLEDAISNNETDFILDGNHVSLYELLLNVSKDMPSNLNRYKGLGEMEFEDLSNSTIHPDGNRTLHRLCTDNIGEDEKIIRQYQSNKKLILEKIDKVSRIDLIG